MEDIWNSLGKVFFLFYFSNTDDITRLPFCNLQAELGLMIIYSAGLLFEQRVKSSYFCRPLTRWETQLLT